MDKKEKKLPLGEADVFKKVTSELMATFIAKNHDYGNSFSILFKECGMTYAYGHMAEKLVRFRQLMTHEAEVNNESIEDSLLDLANYAILTLIEIRNNDRRIKEES